MKKLEQIRSVLEVLSLGHTDVCITLDYEHHPIRDFNLMNMDKIRIEFQNPQQETVSFSLKDIEEIAFNKADQHYMKLARRPMVRNLKGEIATAMNILVKIYQQIEISRQEKISKYVLAHLSTQYSLN